MRAGSRNQTFCQRLSALGGFAVGAGRRGGLHGRHTVSGAHDRLRAHTLHHAIGHTLRQVHHVGRAQIGVEIGAAGRVIAEQ